MVRLDGHRAYLDTNTIIYAVEVPHLANLKAGLLERMDERAFTAVTSELTLAEAIIGPRKAGNALVEQTYRTFLTPTLHFVLEPITLAVLEKVIEIRANFGLKIPDAIHLATGMLSGCNLFVTADLAWARVGVTVVDPADLG